MSNRIIAKYGDTATGTTNWTKTFLTNGKLLNNNIKITYCKLPSGYTELEYIQGAGAPYIVTSIVPLCTDIIHSTFALTSNSVNSTLWCSRNDLSVNTFTSFYIGNAGIRCDYGINQTSSGQSLSINTKYEYEAQANKFYLNSSLIAELDASSFTTTNAIMLFASYTENTSTNVSNFSYMKLYEFYTKSSSGTLKSDFIPAKRNSDSVPGLYDIINSKFYTNAGSGSFTAGPEVS